MMKLPIRDVNVHDVLIDGKHSLTVFALLSVSFLPVDTFCLMFFDNIQ